MEIYIYTYIFILFIRQIYKRHAPVCFKVLLVVADRALVYQAFLCAHKVVVAVMNNITCITKFATKPVTRRYIGR